MNMKSTTMTTEPTYKDGHSKQWHLDRQKGIGGSARSIILLGNDHPFSNPLGLRRDKMGINPPKTVKPAMESGTGGGPKIAQKYAAQAGRQGIPEQVQ